MSGIFRKIAIAAISFVTLASGLVASQAKQMPALPQVEKSGDVQNVQYCRGLAAPAFARETGRATIPVVAQVIIQGIAQPTGLAGMAATAAIPITETATATTTDTGSRWLPSVPAR